MAGKLKKRLVAINIIIFIILPMTIAVLTYIRMRGVLNGYMEKQVEEHIGVLNDLAFRRLDTQIRDMERVTAYLGNNQITEEDMVESEELLTSPDQVAMGILRLDGSAVIGEPLRVSEYPAVRQAFRGFNAVRYRAGEGILFTAPIFHGENIKYVLYECIDEKVLFGTFNDSCYDGRGEVLLMDSEKNLIIRLPGVEKEVQEYLETGAEREEINKLLDDLKTRTVSATCYRNNGERNFMFAADIAQSDLCMVGIVPYSTVAEGISGFSNLVMLVFSILIVLLVVGVARVLYASVKIQESEELRQAKLEVEEANKAKSTFLANMSHELRTPINTIMGMDEMIIRETDDVTVRERAMDIRSASQILLGLINDVLDFSKIESGELKVIPVEYNLANFIRDLSILSENRARAKSLNFQVVVQPDLPIGLFGDDIRFRQVLTNLLINAVKYTPAGLVQLKISGKETDKDTVLLHCEVIDTGIGIKPEDIPKLYIPYVRIEETRNRHLEGSGLGLSIVINLLKLMGSRLCVESVYGEGSNFSFDLEQKIVDREPVGDIHKRIENMVKDYEYKVTCIAPKARVLVVDDNSMNRKIFVGLMKPTQISITTVSSGAKCLDLVMREHFDLIFMDHLMPEMDGVETLKHLKAMDSKCNDTPVIALTANVFSGARERYISWGFDGFIEKPIIPEKLERVIQEMLPSDYLEIVEEALTDKDKEKAGEADVLDLTEEMPEIEGVNWGYALLYIRDKEILWDMLNSFYQNLDTIYQDVSNLAEQIDTEEGMTEYQIQVHTLKSSAAMIGIMTVSELAKLMERAAKAGEKEMIRMGTPVLLKELLWIKDNLEPFVGETSNIEKMPADTFTLLALLDMLRIAMDQMDIDNADRIIKKMNEYSYPSELQKIIDEIGHKVTLLDFSGAMELVSRLIEENQAGE